MRTSNHSVQTAATSTMISMAATSRATSFPGYLYNERRDQIGLIVPYLVEGNEKVAA